MLGCKPSFIRLNPTAAEYPECHPPSHAAKSEERRKAQVLPGGLRVVRNMTGNAPSTFAMSTSRPSALTWDAPSIPKLTPLESETHARKPRNPPQAPEGEEG